MFNKRVGIVTILLFQCFWRQGFVQSTKSTIGGRVTAIGQAALPGALVEPQPSDSGHSPISKDNLLLQLRGHQHCACE